MAHLSIRIPEDVRSALRERLATSGQSLQSHVLDLIDRSLRSAPSIGSLSSLAPVLRTLRGKRGEIERRHVNHLWIFGSVARGEEQADSDVDLIVEFDPEAKVSLTAVSSLRLDLAEMLGRSVDLAEWRTLRPNVEAAARDDAVLVF